MTTITHDEWLAEIERIMRPAGAKAEDGLTLQELAQNSGRSTRWWLARMKAEPLRGRVVARRVPVMRIDGVPGVTVRYRLRPAPTVVPRAAKRR